MADCKAQMCSLLQRWQRAEKEHETAECIWLEKSQFWQFNTGENVLEEGAAGITVLPWKDGEAAWLEREPPFKQQVEELWRSVEAKLTEGSCEYPDLLQLHHQFDEREKHWVDRKMQWIQKEAWFRSGEDKCSRIRFLENQVQFLQNENTSILNDKRKLERRVVEGLKREKELETQLKVLVVAEQEYKKDAAVSASAFEEERKAWKAKEESLHQGNADLKLEIDQMCNRSLENVERLEDKFEQKHLECLRKEEECENLTTELKDTQTELEKLRINSVEERNAWLEKEKSYLRKEVEYLDKHIEYEENIRDVDRERRMQREAELYKGKEQTWFDKNIAKLKSKIEQKKKRARERLRVERKQQEWDAQVQRVVERAEQERETERRYAQIEKDLLFESAKHEAKRLVIPEIIITPPSPPRIWFVEDFWPPTPPTCFCGVF
ncbi:hypothetical protein WMY93_009251 [Mugilogobius chulae]|uniref:Trichoplein keratin filament-binding protein n=1 Tax=Mugilogobius chulae TaxID=88201 RepID=A0AAW0PPT4_9GOBI